MLLLIHGEVTDHGVDIFDREKVFLDQVLAPIVTQYSQLKIVVEHITTSNAVEFVKSASDNVAATITAHHLLYNRNHMLVAAYVLTFIACQYSSAVVINKRLSKPPPVATKNSSQVQIPHHIPEEIRKPPVDVQVLILLMPH